MKSRIQVAGVEYGSRDMVVWEGELPQIFGIPGMRIVLNDLGQDLADAYSFKQLILEIDVNSGHLEQVVYVAPIDKNKARQLLVEAAEAKSKELAENQ